jgi:hypothetical protein
MTGFIDGDFKTEMGDCEFHCSPTCHPGQIGPGWHYGCTHKAWPQNKYGDFVPFVECGGLIEKCEFKEKRYKKFIGRYKQGKSNSLNYTKAKVNRLEKEIEIINKLQN